MRAEKDAIIQEVGGLIGDSEYVFLTACKGMSVAKISDLRASLRELQARLTVTKNTFIRIGAERAGKQGMEPLLDGPTCIVTGGSVTAVAKALKTFAKSNEHLKLKGGLLGTRPLSAGDIDEMANIPPREILLARVVGTIAAPMTQLVGVMSQKILSIVYVLKAVEDKKGGSGQ